MFLPLGAMAFSITTNPFPADPETIATQAGTTIVMTDSVDINIELGDFIVGRTTGFNIRLDLNGAAFTSAPGDPGLIAGPALQGNWAVTLVGVAGDFAQYSVLPVDGTAVIGLGVLATFPGNGLALTTTSNTNQVDLNVTLADAVGGFIIGNGPNRSFDLTSPIVRRQNGVLLTCDTTQGDTDKKIDVASDANQGPKVLFTPNGSGGEIGSSLSSSGDDFFNAGKVTFGIAPNVSFGFLAGDQINLSLAGNFSSAITDVFINSTDDCNISNTIAAGTINTAGTSVAFDPIDPTVDTMGFVCLLVDGVTQIDASTLTVGGNFTRGTSVTNFPTCSVLPMEFNGSVVKVFTFNPAGNTLAESFLRVSNWGTTGGLVTIEGYDDGGNPGDSTIRFVLSAGETLQLNSSDLENGNVGKGLSGAFGDGIGRWRMVVTAEFDNLRVSSLNRNRDSGTVTNLTDADSNGEQALNDSFGN